MLALAAGAVLVEAHAVDQNADLQYQHPVELMSPLPPEPTAFWERFDGAWERGATDAFDDRFHPLSLIHWNLSSDGVDDFAARSTGAARHGLEKSFVYGAREAAIEQPVFLWLRDRQGFLTDFLRNSVGSVQEESVSPLDISYRPVERSFWGRLAESGDWSYGVRPFKTDPYAFLSLGVKDSERLLVLANVRYHYEHFADHRFEVALSVPLLHGFAIDLGTSYQFGRSDQKRMAIKIFKELKHGGVVHVGFEVKDRPVIIAGITTRW